MDLFVAGLPNSGTTHVAHLLQQAGCDFGSDVWPHSLHRKGMEWLPVRDWYLRMFDVFMGGPDPGDAIFTMDWQTRRLYWQECPPPVEPPPCLKVPDFGIHRLDVYYHPEVVLRVVRPKAGWVSSMTKWRPGCRGMDGFLGEVYDMVTATQPADLTVEWPRCVRDVDYLVGALCGLVERDALLDAFRRVTKPEWVTFG